MEDEQSGQSVGTFTDDGMDIPEFVDYINLLYRLACTTFIIGMGSLVISTILKTRSLHNVHNMLVVNLMVADIVGVVIYAFQNVGMTVSCIIGIQDPFRCDVLHFSLFPILIALYTFVMLSVEKFIAIKFALRYKAIVTHRRVFQVIAAGWIIVPLMGFTDFTYNLIVGTEHDKSSRFGSCFLKQVSFVADFFTTVVPVFLAFFITITLDTYLSIKAYQMYKKIQKENGEEMQMSKKKLNKLLRQLKPMITLLVTILGSTAMAVIGVIIYELTVTVEGTSFVKFIMVPNLAYVIWSLHPLVYGLYFTKIRQSLCRRLKRMVRSCKCHKKMNSVLPSQAYNERLIRRAWM